VYESISSSKRASALAGKLTNELACSALATTILRSRNANSKGVYPLSFLISIIERRRAKQKIIVVNDRRGQRMNQPLVQGDVLLLAPFSIRSKARSVCPRAIALCNAVLPFRSFSLIWRNRSLYCSQKDEGH